MGLSPFNQAMVDAVMKELDGTNNYGNLGANAVLVFYGGCGAAAKSLGIPLYYLGGVSNAMSLPVPMLNIINGGSHADNSVDFQEYMIMPVGFEEFSEGLRASAEVYHNPKKFSKTAVRIPRSATRGDLLRRSPEEPIQVIMEAIAKAGYKAGEQIAIALDVAASELVCEGGYRLDSENRTVTSEQLVDYYADLCSKYTLLYRSKTA